MPRLLSALGLLTLSALLSACGTFNYNGYQTDIAAVRPADLAQSATQASLIYFSTAAEREAGLSVHRLLLVTHLDGRLLAGASTATPVRGFQALQVPAGKHSLQWCWLSKNAMGPGGERCGFKADNVEFKAGQRYLVSWNNAKAFEGQATFVRINSQIKNLDSGEVVFHHEQ
ncbi:hypothetical protein [Pseudomonas turukhanskensis]|uniref:Lipoprotein n=1 Tax=Pseudomonas turukhanskensis TaxID=1806536 RepID=A0A9W6K5V6_9PSED|nr:hypothetical protein [Pseudomonas turukhanskensis]GLK88265.1 hypothetical protein GCM10017655_13270 [Pseudomonas turukhanskensis]